MKTLINIFLTSIVALFQSKMGTASENFGMWTSVSDRPSVEEKDGDTRGSGNRMDESNFYALAKQGNLGAIEEAVMSIDTTLEQQSILLYQWGLIAEDFGKNDAIEILGADSLLDGDGGETIASARFEVGCWYLLGTHGVKRDTGRGLSHLDFVVNDLKIHEILDLSEEIPNVRSRLNGSTLRKFNALFPQK